MTQKHHIACSLLFQDVLALLKRKCVGSTGILLGYSRFCLLHARSQQTDIRHKLTGFIDVKFRTTAKEKVVVFVFFLGMKLRSVPISVPFELWLIHYMERITPISFGSGVILSAAMLTHPPGPEMIGVFSLLTLLLKATLTRC